MKFNPNQGPDSGQSVKVKNLLKHIVKKNISQIKLNLFFLKHVHMHILPRRKGDFKKDNEIYEKLQSHDKDMTNNLRTEEEMEKEALELRKLFY